MGHNLDITNDIASFADSRNDAWHGLGTPVGHVMTAAEALDAAHMANWNVRKMPLWTADDDGHLVPVDDRFATVRTNPINGGTDYLGVVGRNYTPIQNEDSADFLNALVDESGARFETAGALNGGRQTFVTMLLPDYMEFRLPDGTLDKTELYLAALNSHDGSAAFRAMITPVRIVCANTQCAAIAAAKSTWSVRHTSNALATIEVARESLEMAFTYADAFGEEMQRLIDAQTDEDEARRLLGTVFAVEDADTERAQRKRVAHVDNVLAGLELPTIGSAKNTLYGLYNAVTEYVDHRIEIKGENGVSPEKQLMGTYADLKNRAFSILTAAI